MEMHLMAALGSKDPKYVPRDNASGSIWNWKVLRLNPENIMMSSRKNFTVLAVYL